MASESSDSELPSNWSQMEDLINNTFDNIISLVIKRRETVLSQLKEFIMEHTCLSNSIEQLKSTISLVQETLNENPVIDVQEKTTVDLRKKLSELEPNVNIHRIFVCNQKELNRALASLGSIEVVPSPYMDKTVPKLAIPAGPVCNLKRPVRLSVDESLDLIAVTDRENSQVCLFSLKGEFINSFGVEYFSYPLAVKIISHSEIIVSDSVKQCISLIHYERNKKRKFKVKLTLEEINSITSLDFDRETDLIYATESISHSLLVLNKEFKTVSELKNKFLFPQNVFVNNEEIYIQDFNNPSLHILTKTSLEVLRSVIARGFNLDTEIPLSFFVDNRGYILVGEMSGEIQVYSPSGQMLHSFAKQRTGLGEIVSPHGVCVLANYDVIVISDNTNYPIQVF